MKRMHTETGGTGQALYEKAKGVIPGGTQLLSKRPELFLPGQWPSYYRSCRGAEVVDLDGKRYVDMSINGVGACILGYADRDVDAAVKRAVEGGSMCTLNPPEEVELAELLCELHPWADMVRFARGGGEAAAVAVRIARAATGRDKVAFCGYHGWHDWYIAANLADGGNLDGQLLPGLLPAGVPRGLEGTALPFVYNDPSSLELILEREEGCIAAVVMEPVRHSEPEPGFLSRVRDMAAAAGAVLIFDEVTSAWRMNPGGIHLLLGVNPDMAVFAKGMSNGYPMAAVIGVREVMEAAQKTFISSTYWTERIGPAAALATIGKIVGEDVPRHLCGIGGSVRQGWESLGRKHGLKVVTQGIPPLSVFSLDYGEESGAMHTLFTQEMLRRGFLSSRAFYATYAHTEAHVQAYLSGVDEVFGLLSTAVESGIVTDLLDGPAAHSGFRRLA